MLFAETGTIGLGWGDYSVLLVYILAVVFLGLFFSRKKSTTDAYLLGGGKLPWWAVGISLFAALTSTLSLVGVPGEAYKNGFTFALGVAFSPIFAIITFYIFVRYFFRTHVFTPFGYLAGRFDDRVRIAAAALVSLARFFYLGLVLYSTAKVFQGAANWDISSTILLVGLLAIIYTSLGGIQAVVWVDTLQFLIMAGGLGILVVKLVSAIPGGFYGVFSYAIDQNHFFAKPEEFYSFSPYVRLTLWLIVMQMLVQWTFYNSSDQISIQRMLSTGNYKQAKKSLFMMLLVDAPMMLGMFFIGLALWVYYQHQPVQPDADLALFRFVTEQLPSPVPGLIVAAMLAAVLSTVDSGIHGLATILTKDFYLSIYRPNASEAIQVRFAKLITLVVGGLAVGMALAIAFISESAENKVLEAAMIWMATQSIVPGVFILAVFRRRATANHALVAIAAGILAVAGLTAWYYWEIFTEGEAISPFYIGAAGLAASTLAGLVASCFGGKQQQAEPVS